MEIKKQIKKLPQIPSVYFFHGKTGRIIYIGKAANLKERVNSHFADTSFDRRKENLFKEVKKISFIELNSEVEALFLEAEFIKRYRPKYNVEWKDEKNFLYVKIKKAPVPEIHLVRRPIREPKVIFFGPYTDSKSLRKSLRVLARIFPIKYKERGALRRGILWHEEITETIFPKHSLSRRINLFFKGKVAKLSDEFKKEMKKAVRGQQFEKASLFRDRIKALSHIKDAAIFREEESRSIKTSTFRKVLGKGDLALSELKERLKLINFPHSIEAFDISNIYGKEASGSMVVFKEGIPQKDSYRRFKIRTVETINDYKMLKEVLERRLKNENHLPDLILIDGGKGHLNTALKVAEKIKKNIDVISIAKRKEEIYIIENVKCQMSNVKCQFKKVVLEEDSPALLLLRRIRDEAHRFAIIYHRLLRARKGRFSELDNIRGVGYKTKKKLIREFKSVKNIKNAPLRDLKKLMGEKLAEKIKKELKDI